MSVRNPLVRQARAEDIDLDQAEKNFMLKKSAFDRLAITPKTQRTTFSPKTP